MKIGQQIRFIVINKQANSLYSLIADGQYRSTSLGRDTWKSLIGPQGSLQIGCNKEGFNAKSYRKHFGKDLAKARIGIIGNEIHDCGTCDSRIGFGTGGEHNDSNACGNENPGGGTHTKGLGYILVQWDSGTNYKLRSLNHFSKLCLYWRYNLFQWRQILLVFCLYDFKLAINDSFKSKMQIFLRRASVVIRNRTSNYRGQGDLL